MTSFNPVRWLTAGRLLVLLAGLCISGPGLGAQKELQVKYLGMHAGKANLSVNRRSHLLKPGQTAKGVTLLSVNKKEVIVRIDGKNYRFARGSATGKVLPSEVVLERDAVGMFQATVPSTASRSTSWWIPALPMWP